jgi:RNA 2',3'-cyclic 3'-phosphodiesterase
VTPAGSVVSGDRARLFCALGLPDGVLDALEAWEQLHVSRGRAVPRANLHITLAFLGWTPRDRTGEIAAELRQAAARALPIELEPVRYRETRSVGMLVLSDAEGAATGLADDLHSRLEGLGVYEREARRWLPHLTVVRFKERPRLRPPLPETGAFAPSDAAVYLSRLSPGGAEYVVLESVELGGM